MSKANEAFTLEEIAGMSNEELCEASAMTSGLILRHFRVRRGKTQAMDRCTQLFLLDSEISRRLGAMEFVQVVTVEEEEDDREAEPREMSMTEMLAMTETNEDDEAWGEHELRLDAMRRIMQFLCHGCTSAEAVTRKLLALVRRVSPEMLAEIGTSQTAVARALGERRATTSKREQREFEAPMKRAGARGVLGAGTRGEGNREACRRAQMGNGNRNQKKLKG